MIYGSIPAAGIGSRLQPLAFSKELSLAGDCTVIEHTLERMLLAGINKVFVTIDPDKLDIPRYLSTKSPYQENLIFLVKPRMSLPDDAFYPANFIREKDSLYFGLPDTIWFPKDGYCKLREKNKDFVFGLFDTGTPERFDSVSTKPNGRVTKIQVKVQNPDSKWTWGIGKITAKIAKQLVANLPDGPESTRLLGVAAHKYAKNHPVYAIKFKNSSYIDLGRREDYQKAAEFIKKHEAIS